MEDKKAAIRALVLEMLNKSFEEAVHKVDTVLNSGCIDIEGWDEKKAPMFIPKCILKAVLEREAYNYAGNRTGLEAKIRKESLNIQKFI